MLSVGDQSGFEAYVTHQNGTRYAEHEIEDSLLSTMCYLQSQEGKIFRIHLQASDLVKKLNPRHDWIVAYRVDGRLIYQVAIRRGTFHEVCSEMHSEEADGLIVQGRLTFAKVLATSHQSEVTQDEEVKAGLGEIRVDIYDGQYGREVAWAEPVLAKADVGVALEEQAKRIGSCTSATLQTPWISDPTAKEVKFHYNDSSAPFYSFVFIYRTRIALEILKIIEVDRDALEEESAVQIGTKRKTTVEESGIPDDLPVYVDSSDSEDEDPDASSNEPRYGRAERQRQASRIAELERKLRIANMRNPGPKLSVADAVDLTGIDDEGEEGKGEEEKVKKGEDAMKEEPKVNG